MSAAPLDDQALQLMRVRMDTIFTQTIMQRLTNTDLQALAVAEYKTGSDWAGATESGLSAALLNKESLVQEMLSVVKTLVVDSTTPLHAST